MPAPLVSPLDLSAIHVPPHFRCPISLELMRDPVTVSTGQTYDRSSIDSWVATGNTTCPVTRAPLDPAFTPIPNHTLRRLIQDWCVANRSQGVERIPTPVQPANPEIVRALMAQAQAQQGRNSSASSSGSQAAGVDPRVSAVRRLRALVRESEKSRALVAEHRSDILALAFRDCANNTSTRTCGGGGEEDNDDDTTTTTNTGDDDHPPSPSDLSLESVALASALPLSEDDSASVASRPHRLSWLSRLLRLHPCLEARASAAGLIEAVSAGAKSPDHKAAIGAAHGVMDGLVALLALTTGRTAARAAIKALFSLCLAKQNRDLAVSSGAATALVRRIASSSSSSSPASSLSPADLDRSDLERALATVELLCRSRTGVEALVSSVETASMSASAMVSVMAGRASDRAAEHAAGALLSVCAESGAARSTAVDGGVVSQLLLMVQGGCTERGKRKAQALLKLLWSAAAWAPPQQRDGHRVEDDGDYEDGISLEDKIRRRHQPHGKDWSVAADTGVFLHHHHHHHHNPPHRQPQQHHAAALLR